MNDTNIMQLLVVEDEPFLRDLLLMKFNQEGMHVTYTDNGEEALRIAVELQPHAILLDLVLPGMSGFEILEKLKGEDATKKIPVIVLSNLSEDSDMVKCKNLGAEGVLVKAHSSPSAIIAEIERIVGIK